MQDHSSRPNGGSTTTNFSADGDARVGMQAGVVNGNVHIYDVGQAATPRDKLATALNLLAGNMPRRAEELIREAVEAGLISNEVCYYWALSVLSGRTFDHLGQEEFATLQACTSMVDQDSRDCWLAALDVIMDFVNCLIRQEQFRELPEQEFDQLIAAYEQLANEQREEIRRHLDPIMTGALQDRVDARDAAESQRQRMSDNRAERAWKFFEAVPCPPLPATLTPPVLSTGRKIAAGFGALLLGVALLVLLVVAFTRQPLLALAFVAGIGAGGYLIATKGLAWLVRREQGAADAVRHGEPVADSRYSMPKPLPATDPGDYKYGYSDAEDERHNEELAWVGMFRLLVQPLIDAQFADQRLDGANKRRDWEAATAGLRQTLAADIRDRYAVPDRVLGEVAWLIKWHAKRAKERWDAGTLRARRDELRTRGVLGLLTFVGCAAVTLGLLCGLMGAFAGNPADAVIALLLGAAGAWVARRSAIDVYTVQRGVYQAESAFLGAEYAQERDAFDRWTNELKDRPTDAEMARWLDYDKLYAKRQALKAHGLTNRDLIADAILTEALEPCQRARVLFGPPRYSRYRIIAFLLTEGGLRIISANLDFFTGTLSNQLRDSFRYDAISSARVVEVGVRFDSGRRSVTVLDESDGHPPKDADSLILSQGFRLSLLDGRQHIDVVVEKFDHGFLDRLHENVDALRELALDSSGINGALRVLESVAAEGREWFEHERTRRTRRLLDFRKTLTGRGELSGRHANGHPQPALERPAVPLPRA